MCYMYCVFIEFRIMFIMDELILFFSGLKLLRNNDILIFGVMYLSGDEVLIDVDLFRRLWVGKNGKVFWRGDVDCLVKMFDGGLIL